MFGCTILTTTCVVVAVGYVVVIVVTGTVTVGSVLLPVWTVVGGSLRTKNAANPATAMTAITPTLAAIVIKRLVFTITAKGQAAYRG